jgi:PmbA protein
MFANLVAVADDVDRRGNVHTGSVWIKSMTIAGD